MAGLCEGGNEPPGSLKATKYLDKRILVVVCNGTKAASAQFNIPIAYACNLGRILKESSLEGRENLGRKESRGERSASLGGRWAAGREWGKETDCGGSKETSRDRLLYKRPETDCSRRSKQRASKEASLRDLSNCGSVQAEATRPEVLGSRRYNDNITYLLRSNTCRNSKHIPFTVDLLVGEQYGLRQSSASISTALSHGARCTRRGRQRQQLRTENISISRCWVQRADVETPEPLAIPSRDIVTAVSCRLALSAALSVLMLKQPSPPETNTAWRGRFVARHALSSAVTSSHQLIAFHSFSACAWRVA
ncbi:hypothetical protein ANN_14595 [Periplaneta americana]|uniref:Uncharacterized protein n=1 Tax=Periplaneta americana TaxID=6978 RepID=A0ABQ8SY05_PERAM|nr:hypothetical protein ANN_14595 [Periplaneta americana]